MKYIFFLFLIQFAIQTTNFRLNTNEVITMKSGDTLISTLGYFKATLISNNCTLEIQSFTDNSTYVAVGNYTSPNVSNSCQFLTIVDGEVITDTNQSYIHVGSGYNLSTILTIDDWGVIRLIGTYQLPNYENQISNEVNISQFLKNSTYFYPASQLSVNFNDMFPALINLRNWSFMAQYGQLDISLSGNSGMTVSYSYALFIVNNSQITDFNGNTFPSAIFPNITFIPRCMQPRLYLDFKPPFVFVADPYWPIFRLYEQGRYKILEVSFSHVFQATAYQNSYRLFTRSEQSVCPPYTFEFNGNCITTCPEPYYHEIRGQFGYCILTCQEYTPKNQTTRICSCYDQYQISAIPINIIQTCPSNALQYPYGCYCKSTGMYFDRSISMSCVSNCPNGTFGINGLCMDCPNDCITCQIDQIYRNYFECLVCTAEFTLINGFCIRSCSPGLAESMINGGCQPCTDPNCLNCSQDINVCSVCNLLYTLQSGACNQSCSNSSLLVSISSLQSVCLSETPTCNSYLDSHYGNNPFLKCISCYNASLYLYVSDCVASCPEGFIANSQNYCYCSNSSTLTVNNQCLQISVCPIQMGWDLTSNSCLSCPFGCLTCFNSACTSCNPGYFLYISPQAIRCRRKSPLFTCDQQYGWIQKTCLVLNYNDSTLGMNQCYSIIANCIACYPQRSDICILCNPGFYNINNTCITACPNGTIPYNEQTCILTEIQNCATPYLKIYYVAFVENYNMISASVPYTYYTDNGLQPANDPVGYIPSYQQLTQRKDDGQFRDSEFYNPVWTCLKCIDGFGLSSDFQTCLPCPTGCSSCYFANNNSCLNPIILNLTCLYYIEEITGLCLQNCSSESSIPNIQNGILYCSLSSLVPGQQYIKIDCGIFTASDGTNHVFFIFDQTIKNGNNITVPIIKKSLIPYVGDANGTNSSNIQIAQLQSGNYISLYDSNPGNQFYILNLTNSIQQMVSTSNQIFPNLIYGANTQLSHPQFMKTWLSFIGEVMSIAIVLLHAVFIGNDLLYKVDNTLILAQTIYYFSFVQLLVGNLLAQFYYGWIFAHFGFFPNFFQSLIPSNYVELAAPNAYKLATLDANVIRNAGFAFSLLIVFLGCFCLITISCWIIHLVLKKPQIWYPRIVKNSLVGGLQFISMTIFYWSVANLLYISGSNSTNQDFYTKSKSLSIFFIVLIIFYAGVRWFFSLIGGLYMTKRILIATILAAAYMNFDFLAPLIIAETVFAVLRYFIQRPERKLEICYLICEYLVYVGVYVLLFLCLNPGVNTIIISIIMFIIIVILAYDLTDVYLQSQNEWLVDESNDTLNQNQIGKQIIYNKQKNRLFRSK